MAKSKIERAEMPALDPFVRKWSFEEVNTGYTYEQAKLEASRCLDCANPRCVAGCPVSIDIPGFIKALERDELPEALDIIKKTNALPAVCGRVCPQEEQCEKVCIVGIKNKPVAIGNLERFVADWNREHLTCNKPFVDPVANKVAVIGSGPAGLSCAGYLAKYGVQVTVFEALHDVGGVLIYGIPEFRLPNDVVRSEIKALQRLGVTFETNFIVGKTATIDELLEEDGFEAVFVGSGAGLPRFPKLPGINSSGVYSANEYLTRVNLMQAWKHDSRTPVIKGRHAVVMGGGNVAMDAVRTAMRLGADQAHIVYRRGKEEMPARIEEVHHAEEEGIIFDLLTNPIEVIAGDDGFVKAVKCVKMELGEPDESGRRSPQEVPGSEFEIKCDVFIVAIGTSPNPIIARSTEDLETSTGGTINADGAGKTSKDKVYAGGDIVSGAATVILAMGAGKDAAKAILEDLETRVS